MYLCAVGRLFTQMNAYFLVMNSKRCKVVEEKFGGFVLVYKLACTELHGSDSFVKCVSRFCVKIRL